MAQKTDLSRKILAQIRDFDPGGIITTGYIWTLYGDGHMSAEFRSRWQGTRTGARYVTAAGYVDLTAIDPKAPDADAKAILTDYAGMLRDGQYDLDALHAWRQTASGTVIR